MLNTEQRQSPISQVFPSSIPVRPEYDSVISGMTLDSRKVKEQFLFVAKSGQSFDGRHYIEDAIRNGASVILCEINQDEVPDAVFRVHESGCPIYGYADIDSVLVELATRFYQTDWKRLKVIGVTGTNGKTSICHFIAQALNAKGYKTAVMGTVGNGFLGELEISPLTTLDVLSVHEKLNEYSKSHADFVCMEVSSHSLAQHRVDGVQFFCAVFSNLTQDHLDYHQSMEEYARCKSLLFKTEGLLNAVINIDSVGEEIARELSRDVSLLTFKQSQILSVEETKDGLHVQFGFENEQLTITNSELLGDFNAENLVLAFLVLKHAGFENQEACSLLGQVQSVSGRMQEVYVDSLEDTELPRVFVDFAHTPDALEKILKTLTKTTTRNLILVFGCGGNRDKDKRAKMAKVAQSYADFIFVTSDNPRNEKQENISKDILSGFDRDFLECVMVENDRAFAIERAIFSADKDDVVVIAGKGHEAVQIIGEQRLSFSDQDVALSALLNKQEHGGLQ